MDLMTLLGLAGGTVMFVAAMKAGGALAAFANLHGVGLVVGGTLCAAMINSSRQELATALSAIIGSFRSPAYPEAGEMIPALVGLVEQARLRGVRSIRDGAENVKDGGFFSRALEVAVASGDSNACRGTLEREINQVRARHREVGNVLRTMGMLSPMFGLLGTLIGIVSMLRNISDPKAVGPAMAMSISTAFYGILFSNMFFVPLAGKLRSRSVAQLLAMEVTMEAVLDIVYSNRPPVIVEMRLLAYVRRGGPQSAPEAAGDAAPARG